ncbi:hypothetical protein JJD41_16240 [Oxynema sp. CENA135]|uniref:hypothetical protein n=1 Tax=Oxynema sp. CENA135 TaxID=984206 RepID=UPI00190B011C|nr:hypothetical protein [Oxynema sp. CENA135]MBK4731400.1 hypothetical protein [Oxynema sp. CENA135]
MNKNGVQIAIATRLEPSRRRSPTEANLPEAPRIGAIGRRTRTGDMNLRNSG